MKYWEGLSGTVKEGICGTMDNDGHVPHSVEIMKSKYDKYVASLSIADPVNDIIEYEDVDTGKTLRLRRVK